MKRSRPILKIIEKETLDSTNDYARGLGENGTPEITVVRADYQRKGRGRRGRKWVSPPGQGLYVSFLLRPSMRPQDAGIWTLAAALATLRVVLKYVPHAKLKWPNDIVVDGKKLGGVLTEAQVSSNNIADFIVTGIGLNVNSTQDSLPKGAASLYMVTGRKYSVNNLFKLLIKEVIMTYREFIGGGRPEVIKEIRKHMGTLHRTVEVITGEKKFKAEAVGLNEDGVLIVKRGDREFNITSGAIVHLR